MIRSSDLAVLILGLLLFSCGGTPEKPEKEDPLRTAASPEKEDYWVERFGPYMTPEFRKAYLATPPKERLSKHGDTLWDFQQREYILSQSKVSLKPDQLEAYRRLPDSEACEAYLASLKRP